MENLDITIVKTEKGFNVTVPYALKDSFKMAIPSAKWNSSKKCWEIGPRSGKKAEIWMEQAQTVVVEIKKEVELESTEEEFNQALKELETIKKNMIKQQAKHKSLNEILDDISAIKEQIAKVSEELAKENQIVYEKQMEIENIVNDIIDIDEIENAIHTMKRLQGKFTSANRKIFEEAQDFIYTERQKLKKAGLGSNGLNDLCSVNWNRPDRDKVEYCRDIYDIYKIEEE